MKNVVNFQNAKIMRFAAKIARKILKKKIFVIIHAYYLIKLWDVAKIINKFIKLFKVSFKNIFNPKTLFQLFKINKSPLEDIKEIYVINKPFSF